MARDVGLAQARNVERMANSALMLNPEYDRIRADYVEALVDKSKRD
jgi:enoyl-CoA hydratase